MPSGSPPVTGRRAPQTEQPPAAGLRLLGWSLAALAVALVHNRLWGTPNLAAFAEIAAELGSDPFGRASESDYLLTNLAMPTIARVSGMTEPHRYALAHLLVLVAGLGGCVALAMRRFGYLTARTLVVLVAASPGVTVVMQWLGQPDALTFPLGIAMALVRRRAPFLCLAAAAGLTHPEQAVLVVASAAVVRTLVVPAAGGSDSGPTADGPPTATAMAPRDGARRLAPDLLGGLLAVGLARLGTEIYLRVFDIGLGRPRSDYLEVVGEMILEHHGRSPLALVYLLWGPLWLVIVAVVVLRVRRTGTGEHLGRPWGVSALLALAALVPVVVTLDETRVYAMLTAPVLAAAAVLLGRELAATSPRAVTAASAALLAVTLVVPGGFTAGSAAWSTDIPAAEFGEFLVDGDAPDPLFLWLISPFDFVFPDTEEE